MNTIGQSPIIAQPCAVEERRKESPSTKRRVSLVLFSLVWSVACYFFFSHFVLMAVQIKGASMNPTLKDGDRHILYRCTYLWRAPKQGEIVVIRDPEDHGLSIKRIVATPNDTIEIRYDGVYVNGGKLPEPYLDVEAAAAAGRRLVRPTRLGPQEYYVLGDNRAFSADSRSYGPVVRDAILGKISSMD
jgi:signal peptidase I